MTQVQTMEQNISSSVAQQRLSAILLALFCGVALSLASIGIYGVTSYSVAQRKREIWNPRRNGRSAERRALF